MFVYAQKHIYTQLFKNYVSMRKKVLIFCQTTLVELNSKQSRRTFSSFLLTLRYDSRMICRQFVYKI